MTLDKLIAKLNAIRKVRGGKVRVVMVDGWLPHRIESMNYYEDGLHFDQHCEAMVEEPVVVIRSVAARNKIIPAKIRG